MNEAEVRDLVAEVIVLRNHPDWREDDFELISSGAVRNSQVGSEDNVELSAQMRGMCPEPMLLGADMECGSGFVRDGVELPPQMAIGASGSEELAFEWGLAVGAEARRIGLDVIWSPVLDVNTNPDNPIINVRSFGEDVGLVSRLGAAMTRGLIAGGIHPAAKHWPGHGDVAIDSHISLPTLHLSRERLEAVEWPPYQAAVAAGLESVMTGHLLVPEIDPDYCGTVSPTLIGILRDQLGVKGVLFTDSMGMEGLRQTMDSGEAAWRALAAGHSQLLVDYKRSPKETLEAVVAACMDGRVPESSLRNAAAQVNELKARRAALPPAQESSQTIPALRRLGRKMAEASLTRVGPAPERGNIGSKPLLIVCDDLDRWGAGIADEKTGQKLTGTHPLAELMKQKLNCDVVLCDEEPTPEDIARVHSAVKERDSVIGATFAHILCYKGDGARLPAAQSQLWKQVAATGKLNGMMLFESPYALCDLPEGIPTVVAYGAEEFSLQAAVEGILGERECPGVMPVSVKR